ncbi:hypothetical protein NDU88_005650 [Pleurodeles waltl]|uniref:Uncharacterized protein n=1 Tax=Pleurodeles waltl TaxID=8319 RepID=A0AAV7UK52_PLEWA|nr:hypothetical protein NDU88_005650 [Pleurodeles waltl]
MPCSHGHQAPPTADAGRSEQRRPEDTLGNAFGISPVLSLEPVFFPLVVAGGLPDRRPPRSLALLPGSLDLPPKEVLRTWEVARVRSEWLVCLSHV